MAEQRNPVGWFEIPVTDLQRARTFYEHVFGAELPLQEMGPVRMAFFPMHDQGIGSAGALVLGPGYRPSSTGVVIYFTAPDIEATLERVRENGGKVLSPRSSIGEYGFVATFEDTEGNRIALHSRR